MPIGRPRPYRATGEIAPEVPRPGLGIAIIVEFALERGLSPAAVLAGTGVRTPELLGPDSVVSAKQELTALRNLASGLSYPPALGLALGRYYGVSTLGVYGYACLTSATVGAALRVAVEFWELSYAFGGARIEVDAELLRVHYLDHGLPEELRPLIIERDLLAGFSVIAEMAGAAELPSEVRLSYPEPEHADALRRLMGRPLRFDQPGSSVDFPVAVLDRPLPHADAETHARCVEQCRALLARRRDPYAAALARELRSRLGAPGGGAPSFEDLAARASVSPRTLRRRLAAAGTSFRVLLDQARHATADRLLAETTESVEEIAVRLGYAEAASFIHAYKRWTGTTPARRRAEFAARRHRLR
ncbi:AraC family transcriptional regulator [Nocardia sp. NPDC057227]|uniref:AraC family transcriptional regulator n=1 Tax=Nocardia sp. NPDC057227 TaxID=3346056 RepID=UPI00362AAF12